MLPNGLSKVMNSQVIDGQVDMFIPIKIIIEKVKGRYKQGR